MLQVLLNDKCSCYSIAEMAQMVIESGCGWIQYSDERPEREVAMQLAELCKENETIFIIDHDVDLVNELKVSGVHLSANDMKPRQARELLGPHAIIGADISAPNQAILLKADDIDYVVIDYSGNESIERYAAFVNELVEKGCDMPVVVRGNIPLNKVRELLDSGINGIALTTEAICENPQEIVGSYLEVIKSRLASSL